MTALPSTEDLARLAKAITPGPWRVGPVDDTRVEDADGNEVAQIDGDYNQPETWPLMEANAEAIALLPALIREVLDRREADRWQPIETCPPGDGPVLIYYPDMESDAYYPGHPIHVSNREYVLCGNAAEYGASHWRPIPAPPTTEASHGE